MYAYGPPRPFGPPNVVDVTNSFIKSLQGKYFLGETDQLQATDEGRVWAALVNPHHSGVVLYFDVYVVSNLSHEPIVSQICFCGSSPSYGMLSHEVSPANLSYHPKPVPRGQVQFGSMLDPAHLVAVPVSTRVIPSYSSVTSEKHGHWMIGPGQSIVFTITGPMDRAAPAVVSFGWWEEPQGKY